MKRLIGFWLLAMLAGCATTTGTDSAGSTNAASAIRSTGKDAYSISKQGAPVIGSVSELKGEAFRDARRHCASTGKFLQATAIKTRPGGLAHGPEVTLEFSCLDPHRRAAPRPRAAQPSDGVIELGKP